MAIQIDGIAIGVLKIENKLPAYKENFDEGDAKECLFVLKKYIEPSLKVIKDRAPNDGRYLSFDFLKKKFPELYGNEKLKGSKLKDAIVEILIALSSSTVHTRVTKEALQKFLRISMPSLYRILKEVKEENENQERKIDFNILG